MKFLLAAVTALFLTFSTHGNVVDADSFSKRFKKGSHANSFSKRFKKGSYDFGAQIGGGYTFDLPPGVERTDIAMLFVFPNWQYNVTGLIGESWYQGALFHHVEAGFANALKWGSGSGRTVNGGEWLWGFSPLMAQYKFLSPKRKWAPNILLGAGFSYGDWNDNAYEISTAFEFLLHAGAGVEFYTRTNAWSLNYRLFHVSNSAIKMPNIGLNAHVFSLGMRF
jgi:hypothetical protein